MIILFSVLSLVFTDFTSNANALVVLDTWSMLVMWVRCWFLDRAILTETWLSAQGDEEKTVELAPSGFDVISFPRQSRSSGGGIATI